MAQRLDYLVYYTGNLAEGFDYIYTKRYEGHAFWLHRTPDQMIANVSDPEFDFYNPHFNNQGDTFNWSYDEDYVDMTQTWDHFSEVMVGFVEKWPNDFRGPIREDGSNNEWGVRWRVPGEQEQVVWGMNAYPGRYADFLNYLNSFDPENPTEVPEDLPFPTQNDNAQ